MLACGGARDSETESWINAVRVFDAVSGGDALLVLDAGDVNVFALVAFKDLATGAPRLACCTGKGARLRPGRGRRGAGRARGALAPSDTLWWSSRIRRRASRGS